MKNWKKILSAALVLVMLVTCAVEGVFAESATETIINDDRGWGVFTSGSGRSGTNIRIIGGKYDGVLLGDAGASYNISENVTYTFEAGEFNNVYLHSKTAGSISGNIVYNVNGGIFKNGIKMGSIADYGLGPDTVRFGNIAVVIDGSSDTLSLKKVEATGRTPQRILAEDGETRIGVWMAIVNNCDDTTVPTLSGNAGNKTTVTAGTGENYIDITQFINGDYRIYVKGGEAQPVFDGTTFKGFTLKSDVAGLIPKVTYNYNRSSDETIRKAVAYPTANAEGIYDLSSCNSGLPITANRCNYVTVVEFVPEVEALGASLRFVEDDAAYNGIRFGVRFLQNSVTDAGKESANFGLILISKAAYEAKGTWTPEELKASEKARVATGSVCIEDPATETYTVNAILYNIPEANYQSEIVAIPYIGDTLLTDAMITRSIYSVAEACVADASASQAARDYCQSILDSVTPQS